MYFFGIDMKFLASIIAIKKKITTRPNGQMRKPHSLPNKCLNQSLFLANNPGGRKLKSTDV